MVKKISETFRHLLMKVITRIRNVELVTYKEGISHSQILPNATYSPWKDDAGFISLYEQIKYNTLVDIYRCYELYSFAKSVQYIEADVLEVGVWKGGTARLLSQFIDGNNTLYLADTFEGVVKASYKDSLYKGGEHNDTSETIVNELLGSSAKQNTVLLTGIFPEATGDMVKNKSFKLVHIDVDTHNSAKDTFEFIWDRLVPGGIVVFDDYGFNGCEGVTDYFNKLSLKNVVKLYNINGHGIIIKTAR